MPSMHDFDVDDIKGERVPLASFAGQLCLVVNVASR
jgi:glutathione peroxidase-family protein